MLRRTPAGVITERSALDAVAIAIGARSWWARLAGSLDGERDLIADITDVLAGRALDVLRVLRSMGRQRADAVRDAVDRRRAGRDRAARPSPRLGRAAARRRADASVRGWASAGAGGMDVVSTCHFAVDGYGHAWVAARIAELAAELAPPGAPDAGALPPLAPVADAIPLGIAWRPLDVPAPRALPLAYALGCMLHRLAGRSAAPFSPTMQIPVAPGRLDDPDRRVRRVVQALSSVRFDGGAPEPYAEFERRTLDVLAREADGRGLVSRAARGAARGADAAGVEATRGRVCRGRAGSIAWPTAVGAARLHVRRSSFSTCARRRRAR